MTLEQKLQLLASALDTDVKELRLDRSLETLDEWDSLAHISLIGMFSKSFGRNISVDILKKFKAVEDIVNEMHE